MKKTLTDRIISFCIPLASAVILLFVSALSLKGATGEEVYDKLSQSSRGKGEIELFTTLINASKNITWEKSTGAEFTGNLRVLKSDSLSAGETRRMYLIRKLTGEVYILVIPESPALLDEGADSFYAGLEGMLENKMVFKISAVEATINGALYHFARFTAKPQQMLLDRVFKISIVLMLFFVMVGMGLTLSLKDFALVFKKPKGIILGEVLQFGLMPLVAFGLGHLMGFYSQYPFIFVGMILITAIPGGVTSNLMTYYAKGDLALSISMTSFSTVLSLFFTPLLLGLYCANVPDVTVPVKIVVQTILILVIIPLVIGMSVRARWQAFADKATPYFSILGIIALLFLIIAGVLSNLHAFADTERYGFRFYSMVFTLTMLGMILGVVLPKLMMVNNYQTRAVSLESGLRNASLAMAIAILIQDVMGDFYSSMFVVSGIFGLLMYVAGFISIFLYKKILPVEERPDIVIDSSDEV